MPIERLIWNPQLIQSVRKRKSDIFGPKCKIGNEKKIHESLGVWSFRGVANNIVMQRIGILEEPREQMGIICEYTKNSQASIVSYKADFLSAINNYLVESELFLVHLETKLLPRKVVEFPWELFQLNDIGIVMRGHVYQ